MMKLEMLAQIHRHTHTKKRSKYHQFQPLQTNFNSGKLDKIAISINKGILNLSKLLRECCVPDTVLNTNESTITKK